MPGFEKMNIDIQFQKRPIGKLIPRENNSRTHSHEQIALIAGWIRELRFTNPTLGPAAERESSLIGVAERKGLRQ